MRSAFLDADSGSILFLRTVLCDGVTGGGLGYLIINNFAHFSFSLKCFICVL